MQKGYELIDTILLIKYHQRDLQFSLYRVEHYFKKLFALWAIKVSCHICVFNVYKIFPYYMYDSKITPDDFLMT